MTTPLLRAGSPAARAAYDLARGERIVQLCTEPGTDRLSGVASALVYLLEMSINLPPRISVAVPDPDSAPVMGEELIRGFAAAGRPATWEPYPDAVKVVLGRWFKGVWIDLLALRSGRNDFGGDNGLLILDTARSGQLPYVEGWRVGQLLVVDSGRCLEGPVTRAMSEAVEDGWPYTWCEEIPIELILAGGR